MANDASSFQEDGSTTATATDPSIHVRSPQQSRSRDTLDRIHSAALELMAQHGVAGVTVRDVVERAGSSVGSFYARFSGREQLVRYLRAHAREEVLEAWGAALQLPAVATLTLAQRVEVLVAGHLDVAGGDESRTLLMQDRNGPVQRRMRDDAVALLQSGADDLPRSGGNGSDAALGWEMTVAAAGALLARQTDESDSLAPGEIQDELVRLLLGYLGAPIPQTMSAEPEPASERSEPSSYTEPAEPPPPPALPEPEPASDVVDPFDVWA